MVRPRTPTILDAAGGRGLADVGPAALLAPVPHAFLRAEPGRIQRRGDIRAIAPPASDLAVNPDPRLEPRGWNDHRFDQRSLDAVEHRRLVPLVDDADRHEQHASPDVKAARQQEVEVGLLQFEFAGLLEPSDQCVLQFQLADEADTVRELMSDEEDEAMEIELTVLQFGVRVVHLHIAGKGSRRRRAGRVLGRRVSREAEQQAQHEGQ